MCFAWSSHVGPGWDAAPKIAGATGLAAGRPKNTCPRNGDEGHHDPMMPTRPKTHSILCCVKLPRQLWPTHTIDALAANSMLKKAAALTRMLSWAM